MFRHAASTLHKRHGLLYRGAGLLTACAVIAGTVVFAGARPALAVDTERPPAPQQLLLSPSPTSTDGTVVLTWTQAAAPDVAYYQIFRTTAATPADNVLTYLGRTDDARNYFIDAAPSEGTFRYAVMAVDTSGNAGPAGAWASINVDLPANGAGTIQPDTTAPVAVTNLTTPSATVRTRRADLAWTAVTAADLWRYLVYRTEGTNTKMIGYVEAGHTTFSDVLTADGNFQYHVVAQDKTGNAAEASAKVSVAVDTTAPVITITAPVNGQSYQPASSLTIAATIADAVSGYEANTVKYYLDNTLLTSPTLQLSSLAAGAHTVKVEATDKAGNTGSATATFVVGSATTNPAAPQNLTVPQYSKTRIVNLTWSAPLTGSVTVYKIYRATGSQQATLVGAALPTATSFTETVAADGTYTYHVIAENGTQASPASNLATVTVDSAAPTITVTAPKAGATYQRTGTLAPQVSVADTGSGYETTAVRYLLDGTALTGSINLAALTEGNHTFKVEVTDRAGNAAAKTVTFKVGTATTPDDDDEDDDEDDDADKSLIELLTSLRAKMHHGHYAALMAHARAGKTSQIVSHVIKFRGKHISADAADKILEYFGIEADDDFAGKSGKGKGRGR